jgi:hypothetical protein
MAPQSKVAAKSKVKAAATKNKAAPKGLQLSAAQWKAYNKAYNATATAAANKIALTAAANRFRKYRLQSAYATIKQAAIGKHNAQVAAIAAFAAKRSFQQSKLAHQNKALLDRVEQDSFNHANLAGRLQYVQGGEKAYAHKAVMRTVDTKQAVAYEKSVIAKAAKVAKAVAKTTSGKGKTKIGAAINAQAAAAGLKAASKVRTAPYLGVHRGTSFNGNGHWILGLNDFEGTCIMTAVANALHHQTGWWLPDEDIAYWTGRTGKSPTIGGVLRLLYELQPWPQVRLLKPTVLLPSLASQGGSIIGFGDHAAYAFGSKMVSYAELLPRPKDVEEAWTCEFYEPLL